MSSSTQRRKHKVPAGRELVIETPRKLQPLLGDQRYKGIHGGRGSGKSHFFAELLVEDCLADNWGMRAICIREVQKSLSQSVKLLIEDKIKLMGVSSAFRVLDSHIEAPRGGIIDFTGMNNHTADTIKSLEGYRRAFVEEGQTISQRSLTMLTPTIRAPGSQLWFAWNPEKPTDPVDDFFRGKNKHPNSVCVELNYEDNPWFPDELREDMEFDRDRDPDKYAWVWAGKYRKVSQNRVLKNWRVSKTPLIRPQGAVFYFGADWGFSNDPTVLVCGWLEGRNLYIYRAISQVGVEIDDTPAFFDTLDPARPGLARKWVITADNSRPETISYCKRKGYPNIRPSKKGKGSVEEGVKFVQNYNIIIDPSCVCVINELSDYSYKVDKLTGQPTPELEDDHNHTVDAIRYMLEDARRAKGGVF